MAKLHCWLVGLALLALIVGELAAGQRDDDFNDSGYDDSGYPNSAQGHDADGSSHNPQGYAAANEEESDDDDDVDETHMRPQVQAASDEQSAAGADEAEPAPGQTGAPMLGGPMEALARQMGAGGPAGFAPSPAMLLDAALGLPAAPQMRYRRSLAAETDGVELEAAESRPLNRQRRYAKHYIGPVYTYVKTDKHARYKWGVKHKVGKHHG